MAAGNAKKETDSLASAMQDAKESARKGVNSVKRSLLDRIATFLGAAFPYAMCAIVVVLMWNGGPRNPFASATSSTDANQSSAKQPANQAPDDKQPKPPHVDDHGEPPDEAPRDPMSSEPAIAEIGRVVNQTDSRLDLLEELLLYGLGEVLRVSADKSDTRSQALDGISPEVQSQLKSLTVQQQEIAKTLSEDAWNGREKRILEAIGKSQAKPAGADNLPKTLEEAFARILDNKLAKRLEDLTDKITDNELAITGIREQFQRAARHEQVAVIFYHNEHLKSDWYLPSLNAALRLGRLTTFPNYQLHIYRGKNDAVELVWPQRQATEVLVQRDLAPEKPGEMSDVRQQVFKNFQFPVGVPAPHRRCILIVSPKCAPITPNIPASAAWQGVQTSVLVLEKRIPGMPDMDAQEYRSVLNRWQEFCQWGHGQAVWFNLHFEEKRGDNPPAGKSAPNGSSSRAATPGPASPPKPNAGNAGQGAPVATTPANPKGTTAASPAPNSGAGGQAPPQPAGGKPGVAPDSLTPECASALRETLFRLLAPSFSVE